MTTISFDLTTYKIEIIRYGAIKLQIEINRTNISNQLL